MKKPLKGPEKPPHSATRSGFRPTPGHPLVPPIQPSVVYCSDGPDALDAQYDSGTGFTYAREGHPNAESLAARINGMEGAAGGLITGSGMAALSAVFLGLLRAGDHVVAGDQLYGRSLRLLAQDLPRLGLSATLADAGDGRAMEAALRPNTRMILVEVVANPTLRLADMEALAQLANDRGILLVVDNTFTTPRAFQPLARGADLVLHSVTKLLAGHSDVTLGYVGGRDPALVAPLVDAAVTWGLTPSPQECWLAERGLLSFDLRHERACANAAGLADFLAARPEVSRLLYPGRPEHPDHNRARALLGECFGNMVSLELPGGRRAANAFCKAMPEIAFAPTLGDITTTLSHPASSSHRGLSAKAREDIGISEGFFRVSVGIEPLETLCETFAAGLVAASAA